MGVNKMRKIMVLEFLSLDGILQAPGGPEEDTSGGFRFGGWTVPYTDDFAGQVMARQMGHPFDLLLGRKTYEIFAGYWPHHPEGPGVALNKAVKYVASTRPGATRYDWERTVVLAGEVVEAIRKLKGENGPELQVYGSGNFVQTLLRHDLVDELWLKIFPITLGGGKRLFAEGTVPAAFRLRDSAISPKGVIIANYERAGEVRTGSFD